MRLGSGFSKGARTFPLTPVQSWFIGPGDAPIRRGHSIIATVISWRTLGSKADTARPLEGQKDFFSQGGRCIELYRSTGPSALTHN
jgi:hypothetical protein